ncbi:hypothetical protein JL09_g6701 [Pichia kudriavzevii]|uniref:Uncharacterized protein n=1 Tax=Pichia kudriavzevii TaxID=4909 RepID=A0A099NL70_PICKU|nr:hypothetical protein JL09_g6701 [Pichia kudriavzevii]
MLTSPLHNISVHVELHLIFPIRELDIGKFARVRAQ